MNRTATPQEIVGSQLIAYNARDLQAYCALFADHAVIRLLNGRDIARGVEAIRAYYRVRFSEPNLHCTVLSRLALGDHVIDHEQVVGVTEQLLEVIAIYEVREGLIQAVDFIWPRTG